MFVQSIFWEQPYFETRGPHYLYGFAIYNDVICDNSNLREKFERQNKK